MVKRSKRGEPVHVRARCPLPGGNMIYEEIANYACAERPRGMGKLGGTSVHAHMTTWNTLDRREREAYGWKRERELTIPPTPTSLLKRCSIYI